MKHPTQPIALGLGTIVAGFLFISGCTDSSPAYTPGLGEIMTLTQMRHAKLWLAGAAGNWPLADYELDELQEGFDDAVRFHPTHKAAQVSIAEALPALTAPPLANLRAAIAARDPAAFGRAFDALTAACNACHRTTDFAFNVVARPAHNPFANQDFAPPASAD